MQLRKQRYHDREGFTIFITRILIKDAGARRYGDDNPGAIGIYDSVRQAFSLSGNQPLDLVNGPGKGRHHPGKDLPIFSNPVEHFDQPVTGRSAQATH